MGTCFLHGRGGGAALNFKIVGGTTQPSSPAANTIWVNTSDAITSWIFSATQPTGTEGMVWIQTGASSSMPFNAIKSNNVQVYPQSVKQYVSSEWVTKISKIYQNSAWTTISSRVDYISSGGILIDPVSNYNGTITQTGNTYKISAPAGDSPVAVNFACNNMAGRTVNITITSCSVYPNQSTYYSGILINTSQTKAVKKPGYVALTKIPTSDTTTTYTLKIPDSFNSGYLTVYFQTYSSYTTYYAIRNMWIE